MRASFDKIRTEVFPLKPVPRIRITFPPLTGPEAGVSPVMVIRPAARLMLPAPQPARPGTKSAKKSKKTRLKLKRSRDLPAQNATLGEMDIYLATQRRSVRASRLGAIHRGSDAVRPPLPSPEVADKGSQ